MADNIIIDPGSSPSVSVATDEVTYSGDTAKVQLVRPVLVSGVEGSKTVVELTGDATYGLDVDVTRSALPTGAATAAKQDTGNTSLSNIDGKLTTCNTGAVVVSSSALPSGAATSAKQPSPGTAGTPSADVITVQGAVSMTPLKVDGSAVTQPVSAAALPLPAGASTSAKQDTGNSSLASIDGKLTACNTGAVVVSSSALPAGAATSAKQPTPGTAGSPSADVITVQGTASMSALKVDGSAVTQPVSASALPLPTGASTAARQDTGNTSLSSIDAKVTACNTGAVVVSSSALPTGAATSAKQDAIIGYIDGIEGSLASIDGKISACNTGAVVVSSSALPSGAATAAKQPTLGTAGTPSADVITIQGAASMTPLKTDGSAVTQPISAASLPLPSGASTAAKQPALGTAGTPSADVITIQGAASMTAVKVDGSDVVQPVSGTVQPGNTANTTPWLVSTRPGTSGGFSTFHLVSAASTNATNVKSSAGQLFGGICLTLTPRRESWCSTTPPVPPRRVLPFSSASRSPPVALRTSSPKRASRSRPGSPSRR